MKKILILLWTFSITSIGLNSVIACTPKDEVGENQTTDGVLTLEEYTIGIQKMNQTTNKYIRTWPTIDYKINVNTSEWENVTSGILTQNVKLKIIDRFLTLVGGQGFWHYSEKAELSNFEFSEFEIKPSSKIEQYDFSVLINFKGHSEPTKITGTMFNEIVETQTDLNKSSFEKSIATMNELKSKYGVNSSGYFIGLDFYGEKNDTGRFDSSNYTLTKDLETLNINYMNMWMRNLNIYDQFLNPSPKTFNIDWQSGWLKPGSGISISEDGSKIWFEKWEFNTAVSLTNISFENSDYSLALTGSYLLKTVKY